MSTKEELRSEYRRTWETFSRQMKTVLQLTNSAEPALIEAAKRDAEFALAAHKEARDKLATLLTPRPADAPLILCPIPSRAKAATVA